MKCANCKYYQEVNPETGQGLCYNPTLASFVQQEINADFHACLWYEGAAMAETPEFS